MFVSDFRLFISIAVHIVEIRLLNTFLTITVTQGRELMVNGFNIGWEVLAQKEIG